MARMDEGYFEEKRNMAMQGMDDTISNVKDALLLVNTLQYDMLDLTSPNTFHETIMAACSALVTVRLNFEKARWAASNTRLEFFDWLKVEREDLFKTFTA